MALKLFNLQSPLKRYIFNTSISSLSLTSKNPRLLSYNSLSEPTQLDNEVERIYNIVVNSENALNMRQNLLSTSIPFTNELVECVLKRVRFSHGSPLQALDFYYIMDSQSRFFHTQFSLDTMLYVLGRCRKFELMWRLLIETKKKDKSLITPRTLMVVLGRVAKVCTVKMTVEWFKKFRRLVYEFDVDCFNGLLRVLCQEKTMLDARNVYHMLKGNFRPNLLTFNILLSGWKSSEYAESFWKEMKDLGVKPDIVSYNSLMDAYCKCMEIEKAYKLIEEMREEGIRPDVITYTSLIGGLGTAGQPHKARDLLSEMQEFGCFPDVPAYNAAIRNFCIARKLEDAFQLLIEMVGKGLHPNATTFNLFFRVYYWSNNLKSAWSLYQKMKEEGCLPNTQSCMFLIRLCKKHEGVEMALELWDDMVEKSFGSYILVSDVLFDLLCDLGKLDEAEKCFLQMVGKRQKPSNVSFKRIKVLMELANRKEAIERLSERMSIVFGPPREFKKPNDDFDDSSPLRLVAH